MRRTICGLVLGSGLVACAAAPPPAPPAPGASVESPEPGAAPGSPGSGVVSSPPPDPNAAPPGPAGMTYKVVDMGVAVPDEWRACSAATDCQLVIATCCDHCNGGKTVAVNTAHAKDVAAKYPKQCDHVACTARGCMTRPACAAGRCVMEWASGAP